MNDSYKPAWHRRARVAMSHSLRVRLVLVFLLLALAMSITFVGGMQKAFAIGWREAALPLVRDYVDRLAGEIGTPPDIERAQALVRRLPITVQIDGPQVQWDSHPERARHEWKRDMQWGGKGAKTGDADMQSLLSRTTADGHRIEFGLSALAWEQRPRIAWMTLTALLLMTGVAYWYVRRLLRPLDDIRAGALRFGAGHFETPIPVCCERRMDELGELAQTINTMGGDIHQMLEAKRALLLAISHELRSPLTRARLNAELLPDDPEVDPQREALLRDLGEMAHLISDLLESERLTGRHAALHREPTDLEALAREVLHDLQRRHASACAVHIQVEPGLGPQLLDRSRMRLLLRNLLDNSLRHGCDATEPPVVQIRSIAQGVEIEVRDHGPGVPEERLARLSEPFYRPDEARQRTTGGVGLGLYLCRLVVQAHGGQFSVRNASPGLLVTVQLP